MRYPSHEIICWKTAIQTDAAFISQNTGHLAVIHLPPGYVGIDYLVHEQLSNAWARLVEGMMTRKLIDQLRADCK